MCEEFSVLRHTSVFRYTAFKKQPAPFLSSSWLPLQATMAGFNLQHQQQRKNQATGLSWENSVRNR